ncbi:hypothetical protein HOT29_gp049 [Microbacterium phage Squash]|uniref:Uncharacterized protein n=1 Tax=Microbacterium phage Squash TaxID=2182357 RepID=A0A2U8UM38_9CAUD|nr:hypothetical protein HOT29_gp049 [Microbacterium phage Squash]AWN04668.1 hypothetical protein PBI_SQUASH_49 [Microbacterium phage Squash]
MGARASRRRHEGRAIRKQLRAHRELGKRFTQVGIAAGKFARAFTYFVKVLNTTSGSIAFAQQPDGTTLIGIDPGVGHPSQSGVEAVRSTHSVAEKVDAMAARMGFTLASWQRDLAVATLTDQPGLIEAPKGAGKVNTQRVIDGVRADLAWVDEVQ